jgi:PhnB protein
MSQFNPYLNFPGNTEEAFNFYKSVFGGEFQALVRFSEMEGCGEIAEADKGKIAHVALPVGDGNMLMGTDSLESFGQKLTFGNNAYICITPDTREDADHLFGSLSDAGKIEMPMTDMPWGGYFGSFTDKFGAQWMLHYDKNGGGGK